MHRDVSLEGRVVGDLVHELAIGGVAIVLRIAVGCPDVAEVLWRVGRVVAVPAGRGASGPYVPGLAGHGPAHIVPAAGAHRPGAGQVADRRISGVDNLALGRWMLVDWDPEVREVDGELLRDPCRV